MLLSGFVLQVGKVAIASHFKQLKWLKAAEKANKGGNSHFTGRLSPSKLNASVVSYSYAFDSFKLV